MTASPLDNAVTKPVDETVATLVLLELHVTDWLDVVFDITDAVNCRVSPVFSETLVSLSIIIADSVIYENSFQHSAD